MDPIHLLTNVSSSANTCCSHIGPLTPRIWLLLDAYYIQSQSNSHEAVVQSHQSLQRIGEDTAQFRKVNKCSGAGWNVRRLLEAPSRVGVDPMLVINLER